MVRITIFALKLKKLRLREFQCLTHGHKCESCISLHPPTVWPGYQKSAVCLDHIVAGRSSFSCRNLHTGVKERRNLREKLGVHVTRAFFFPLSQGRWWWWESHLTHLSSLCMWDLAQALKPYGKRFIHQVPHLLEKLIWK